MKTTEQKHRDAPEWQSDVLDEVARAVAGDPFWADYLERTVRNACTSRHVVHLAVFVEPYLTYLLEGKKTVESRFSARRFPPYDAVKDGDVILLKRSGGAVVGLCRARDTWFYQLDEDSWQHIRSEFTHSLCAQDPAFWTDREAAEFATLIRVDKVLTLSDIPCDKRDRRGWVVLSFRQSQLDLQL